MCTFVEFESNMPVINEEKNKQIHRAPKEKACTLMTFQIERNWNQSNQRWNQRQTDSPTDKWKQRNE